MAKKHQPTKADASEPKKDAGRPEGSKNKSYDQATANPSRCRPCGSTERAPYMGSPVEHKITGVDLQGHHYTHVVFRRTKCLNCGQVRTDRSYENRV